MKKLSKSRQKIYDFLKEKAQYGIPPSVREICAATGLRSTSTVHAHLKTLEEEGYITRQAGMNRSIHIEGCDDTAQVPIVGRVTAGMPILAVEEVQGYVPYSGRAGKGKELFALHVQGYSMKNAGDFRWRLRHCRKSLHRRRRRHCGGPDRRRSYRQTAVPGKGLHPPAAGKRRL